MLRADRKPIITQMTSGYKQVVQKSISECTTAANGHTIAVNLEQQTLAHQN